jgi:acyl-homoserine lactone acylase PvdQ
MIKHPSFLKASLFSLVICMSACSDKIETPIPEIPEVSVLQKRAENVEIIRDDFGVPHVYAKTDADAVFGLLYAQAEDDFPRIERNYIWATGRLAEVEGKDALFSDLRARLYMTTEEAIAAYEGAPEWLKVLCRSFADGLNYYLETHPEVKPSLITHFEPWMPMFFSEGSIGGDIEQIPLNGIKAFYGEQRNAPRKAMIDESEPSGSNGFAISGELTESGNAMLLINPHTSFYFRGEVHVVSEEGLNAYGAVTWGQFFVYQGFNEKNGWMHTSTRADFIDEFVEDVFEENGNLYYQYGDEKRSVDVASVTLKYRDGDKLSEKTFPTYHTHHGPVTHMVDNKWVTTKINWDPVNALQQSYIRSKTNNHDEFREMMDIRTNSSNNTVYADSDGTIAYYHGNFMPKRDPGFNYSEPVDGSNPNTDWNGLHTVDESISIVNPKNGWIQNANSTPFTAAAEYSPKREDYPAYMAPDAENFRGVHGIQVLTGKSGFTLDNLIETAYDSYLPGFAALIPGLVEAYDRAPQKDTSIAGAIDALRNWDFRVAVDSVPMSLAHFYGMNYRAQGKTPKGLSGMERLTFFGKQSPDEERLAVFKQTVDQVTRDFGQWDTPWGEINRLQRLSGDIKAGFDDEKPSLAVGLASGRWGALAAYGSRTGENTKRLYGYRGNSFVAVVEFGDKVKAKTLLAGGQSGDPKSPHFYDQAQRYVEHSFKDVAYYREDVEKRAVTRYSPGQN